jgi:hypothetical protein
MSRCLPQNIPYVTSSMSRLHAFSWHFLLSLAVGLCLLAFSWFIWYPAPMLTAIGGHEIFLLIVGIDVIVGPLLTFVVFKPGKRSLAFDLAVIVALQIGALIYGISTLLEARPAYVAALGDKFQVVQATEVTEANLKKAGATIPWFGPKWVGTRAPEGRYEVDEVAAVIEIGGGRGHFPKLHIPYESMSKEVLEKSKPISTLIAANGGRDNEIQAWLKRHELDSNSARFQPIEIAASEFALILDGATGSIVGITPFKPR